MPLQAAVNSLGCLADDAAGGDGDQEGEQLDDEAEEFADLPADVVEDIIEQEQARVAIEGCLDEPSANTECNPESDDPRMSVTRSKVCHLHYRAHRCHNHFGEGPCVVLGCAVEPIPSARSDHDMAAAQARKLPVGLHAMLLASEVFSGKSPPACTE